ncbi:MAG: dihydrofolate reductase [Candidatus Nanoarchaeia archaeon]|nr:dihydrofolate reductase [Candidatus Nanoarchaeia archaeon]
MELILIAAVSENSVIGRDGELPWRYSEDLKRFKQLTLGHAVLMGRKTYESIGSPLEGRLNIVLTKNKKYEAHDGICLVNSLADALFICDENRIDQVYVIGGEKVYEAALPFADRLELTEIHKKVDGDAFFPKYDKSKWEEINREDKEEYSFVTYKKIE